MKVLFFKYFIPHEGNNYKPHLLRWEASLILVSIILGVELLFLGQIFVIRNTNLLADILSNVLVEQTNVERQEAGLYGLRVNTLLEQAAALKAQDMAEKGYFAHTTPDGKTPWYWLEQAGYTFAAAGENLAVNFVDSEDVTNAWMESPKHKDNILEGGFTEIGIATARGMYEGRETTFVVQFFGRPIVKPAVAEIKEIEETTSEILPSELGDADAAEKVSGASNELYIEIQEFEDGLIVNQAGTTDAIQAEQAGFIERITTQPRIVSNLLLIILATIILLALLLKIFVAIRIQHPPLIVNGVLVLLIVASAIWFNQYLSLADIAVA
jgi:hypothetical protein